MPELLHPAPVCAGTSPTWRPAVLARLWEMASSRLPLDTSALLHNHTAPEIRALCNQPQAPKREPHQSWPRSLLLVTVPPFLGWRGQKGDPLEETRRGWGWHRQCRPEKGPPLGFGVPAACSAPSQVSCWHLMQESIGDSVPKVKPSGSQTVPRGVTVLKGKAAGLCSDLLDHGVWSF